MYKQRKLRSTSAVVTLALALALVFVSAAPGFAQAKSPGKGKDVAKIVQEAQKNLAKQISLYFYDLQDALWAIAAIARMKGFGIINGYEGNVFKPNNPVTQAEALAMIVRALDMEKEAQEIARRFAGTYDAFGYEPDNSMYLMDWDRFSDVRELEEYLENLAAYLQSKSKKVNGQYLPFVPSNTRWALGYILLAVDQGWVRISEVNPNAPASRAWISMVMVRALGYEDEALAQMKVKLPYKDASAIPKDMVGYVAVAVELGLFQGYPGGTFQPNKAVTRAEMATIIDRFLTGELPEETDYRVRGTVTQISKNKVTVKTSSGRTVAFTISKDALILVGNRPGGWDDLSVGDTVEILSNGQGVALLITLLEDVSKPEPKTVSGEIVFIASERRLFVEDSGGDIHLIKLAPNCKITYGSATLAFEDLRVGDKVQATVGANDLVTALKVTSRPQVTVTGTIVSIPGSRRLSIDTSAGTVQTIRLASNCKITYGSATLAFEDLRVGDKVQATIGPDDLVTALKVTARGEVKVTGTIVSIPGSRRLDIEGSTGKVQTIRLAPSCKITYGSTALAFEELRVSDKIEATIGDSDLVTAIKVIERAPETVTGKIVSIPGVRRITVKDAGGDVQIVRLASDCKITWGSRTLVFDDLRIGDEVVATLGDSGMATSVKVTTRGEKNETLTGVIETITKTKTGYTVVIAKQGGGDVAHALAGDVYISYGTEVLKPEDLRVGDEIKATVAGGKLVEIIIKSRGNSIEFGDVGGVIISISQSAQQFIVTVDDDGDPTSFSVPSGCTIKYGTTTLRRTDLRLGDVIRAELDARGEAVEIRVISRDQ